MRFSSLLYLKALKALKARREKNLWISHSLTKAKIVQKQMLCRPNRAALSPLNPPSGGTQHR